MRTQAIRKVPHTHHSNLQAWKFVCVSRSLSLLIIFIFFVVEWKVHLDYMTLTTILFLPSILTHTNSFQSHQQRKQQQHRIVSIPIPITIRGPEFRSRFPITAARSQFPIRFRSRSIYQQCRIVSRFPIPIYGSELRSRVTVLSYGPELRSRFSITAAQSRFRSDSDSGPDRSIDPSKPF